MIEINWKLGEFHTWRVENDDDWHPDHPCEQVDHGESCDDEVERGAERGVEAEGGEDEGVEDGGGEAHGDQQGDLHKFPAKTIQKYFNLGFSIFFTSAQLRAVEVENAVVYPSAPASVVVTVSSRTGEGGKGKTSRTSAAKVLLLPSIAEFHGTVTRGGMSAAGGTSSPIVSCD